MTGVSFSPKYEHHLHAFLMVVVSWNSLRSLEGLLFFFFLAQCGQYNFFQMGSKGGGVLSGKLCQLRGIGPFFGTLGWG